MTRLLNVLCLGALLFPFGGPASAVTLRHREGVAQDVSASRMAVDQLRRTYMKFLDALQTKDVALLRGLLVDDYWQTLSDGTVLTKEQRIGGVTASDLDIKSLELLAFRAVVHHDSGVATAEVLEKAIYQGKPFELRLRVTIVFFNEGGWKIVSTHQSDMKPGA